MKKTSPAKNLQLAKLQRRLKLNKKLVNFNYRGERTLIVVSGLNLDLVDLQKVKGLTYYEERMLFFLFLLKYKKTKIIYLTSRGFNSKLFDYYIDLISQDKNDALEKRSRLVHIEIDDARVVSVAQKILDSSKTMRQITNNISNPKLAVIRCYNPTYLERSLAIKLGIPLFASMQKFDYIGTKSGGRKIFNLAKANVIPGFNDLKNFTELSLAMARLMINYPYYKKLMIKLDESASGKGNCVFRVKEFLKENDIEISIKSDTKKIARSIRNNFCNYVSFQLVGQTCQNYLKDFSLHGGVVELYISSEIKYSPSVQMLIDASGKLHIVSTHEQILGGSEKQEYLGCSFPSQDSHRKYIINEARKIANWMTNKGMMGNFSIDFVVTYKTANQISKVYPIEINLRKGGATHPFRIAYYLTGATYQAKDGKLYCGKTPIYYIARDIIESENYKGLQAMKLVELVHTSNISFNKNTKRGALVYMPGMVNKYGKFGAICIEHTREKAEKLYKKLIKLVNNFALKSK